MIPLVIGHRGAPKQDIENSIGSFRAAVAAGADGVELDVHSTLDGGLIVHHDELIGATHHITRLTAEQVGALRLANGEPVPTLPAVLQAVGKIRVFIEVKSLEPRFDARLLEAIDAGPNPQGYAVHGFDHRIVRRLGLLRPGLQRWVLSSSYPVHPLQALADAGATTLWQEHGLIDRPLTETLHRAGMQVIAWTADDPQEMGRWIHLGVDGLCTNRPDVARRVVDEGRR